MKIVSKDRTHNEILRNYKLVITYNKGTINLDVSLEILKRASQVWNNLFVGIGDADILHDKVDTLRDAEVLSLLIYSCHEDINFSKWVKSNEDLVALIRFYDKYEMSHLMFSFDYNIVRDKFNISDKFIQESYDGEFITEMTHSFKNDDRSQSTSFVIKTTRDQMSISSDDESIQDLDVTSVEQYIKERKVENIPIHLTCSPVPLIPKIIGNTRVETIKFVNKSVILVNKILDEETRQLLIQTNHGVLTVAIRDDSSCKIVWRKFKVRLESTQLPEISDPD